MQKLQETLACLAAIGVMAGQANASGVGASFYVPGKVVQASAVVPSGQCAVHPGCHSCARLGFACVDHASPAPCSAEGACQAPGDTFGWNRTVWRRWPGSAGDDGGPGAKPGVGPDIPGFEPPRPEEEDQQAPPPIEDEADDEDTAAPPRATPPLDTFDPGGPAPDRPGMELDLPAMPDPALPKLPDAPRPATPRFQDAPPGLPFGFKSAPAQQPAWQNRPQPVPNAPVSLPKPAAIDGPPALPAGFTQQAPSQLLRRLPVSQPATGRYDQAIRPVSANLPISR